MLFDTISYVSGADWNYDIAGSTLSTPADGDVITRFTATRAFTLPADMVGTESNQGVNPLSSAVLTVAKNGVSAGTITINSSGVPTMVTTSNADVDFAVDDVLTITVTTTDSIDDLSVTLKTLAP